MVRNPPRSRHLLSSLMIRWLLPAIALATTGRSAAADGLEIESETQLERRLEEIDDELGMLARFTLRSGVGNIGWLSDSQKSAESTEWAEIRLPNETEFDQIVLVPVLWIDADHGPQADGFPEAFRIVAGDEGDRKGRIIAELGPDDFSMPRIAPLKIDVQETNASWLRVESTRLSAHARNEAFRFKLSEIMVFSGDQNVALMQPVRVSSMIAGWGAAAIYKEALVDGLTPFLMDAAGKGINTPYMTRSGNAVPLSFTFDLGETHAVDGIRLHSAYISEYIPQINSPDFGLPTHFTIKASATRDFSSAPILLDYRRTSAFQAGNILEWRIPSADYRYLRLMVGKDGWPPDAKGNEQVISLDEIEILSKGRNLAEGKPPQQSARPRISRSSTDSLTDGQNRFGPILTTRDWMEQLARRHDLETERPVIAAELNRKYLRQKANLTRMYWIAALLAAGLAFTFLVGRILRMRAIMKTRERIAANLHDELSANLHGLSLLGDMARKNINAPGKLEEVVDRIQHLSQRSRNAARHCTNMLQAGTISEDLVEEVKYTADRLLSDLRYDLKFEGEAHLKQLPRRRRNDLFLFFKECLTNIARHAEASSCRIRLSATPEQVRLIVSDDGMGITKTPPSLERRATLLRARLQTETPEGCGTRIILTVPTKWRMIRR